MSSSKNNKDKGKAIQRAEDYQLQVPTQNQFTPLQQTQFPPLPYKTAWYRAFLLMPNIHSWFFNFHEQCSNTFPVWFYHWWTMFGCLTTLLPAEAQESWAYWTQIANMDLYMKDVQFFNHFNVTWIFSWEYRLHPFLPHPYPCHLSASTKLNGCLNSKLGYAEKKMLNISANMVNASLPFTIYIYSKKQRRL